MGVQRWVGARASFASFAPCTLPPVQLTSMRLRLGCNSAPPHLPPPSSPDASSTKLVLFIALPPPTITSPSPHLHCRYILELLKADLKPRDIMTYPAFENAITLVGGQVMGQSEGGHV